MRTLYKALSFLLTIPLIITLSIFTISNSNITFISFWPLDIKFYLPVWALALSFFFIGLFFGCLLMILNKTINYNAVNDSILAQSTDTNKFLDKDFLSIIKL